MITGSTSPFAKKFHSLQSLTPNDDTSCMYLIVTDANNEVYPMSSLQRIAPPLKSNLLFPCLSDSIEKKTWRRFFSNPPLCFPVGGSNGATNEDGSNRSDEVNQGNNEVDDDDECDHEIAKEWIDTN
eukprot:scaffold68539_cov37-Cyclotella_meneghiniana.AAC.2